MLLAFWIIKIAATTVGETGGDALSMTLNLGYALSVETGVSPAIQKPLRNNAKCDRSVLEAQTTKAPPWSQTDLRLNVSTILPHRKMCASLYGNGGKTGEPGKPVFYRSGKRSPDWLKIKSRPQQELVVCGFTEGKGSRKHLGALLLGAYRNGKLR